MVSSSTSRIKINREGEEKQSHTLFFCKNKVYKNVEPQICQNLKNILDAEIVNI